MKHFSAHLFLILRGLGVVLADVRGRQLLNWTLHRRAPLPHIVIFLGWHFSKYESWTIEQNLLRLQGSILKIIQELYIVHWFSAQEVDKYTECNFSAMLMRRKASSPRRSQGVLVLPQNQHCIGVWCPPSTTSEHCWWGGGKYNEAQPSCTCPPTESTMLRSRWWTTECNSSAMLTRREASTPRRSRGVLALSPSQHCARVGEVHPRYCAILD